MYYLWLVRSSARKNFVSFSSPFFPSSVVVVVVIVMVVVAVVIVVVVAGVVAVVANDHPKDPASCK